LLSDGTVLDQEGRTPSNQIQRAEISETLFAAKAPCEQNWKCGLIELNAAPVCIAIDPEVLCKSTVWMLRYSKIDQRAERRGCIAGGQQRRRTIDHVARPDQMITTLVVIAFRLSPWNSERGNECTCKRLVLVRKQETIAAVIQVALVKGDFGQGPQMVGCLIPLILVFHQMLVEGRSKRLQEIGNGSMLAVAEGQSKSKLLRLPPIQFCCQCNIPIARLFELPIHHQILQVGPSIACTDVST